jgi:ribosomal protein S27AE
MRRLGDTVSARVAPSAGDDRSVYPAREFTCPRCGGGVLLVHRRRVDLLVSFFKPIRRFHCLSTECGWEGNLRIKRFSLLR